ncbi:hypothetical protein D3C86_1337530 [compost metagenome]
MVIRPRRGRKAEPCGFTAIDAVPDAADSPAHETATLGSDLLGRTQCPGPDRCRGVRGGALLAKGHPDAPGHGHLPDDHDRRGEAVHRASDARAVALRRDSRPDRGGPGLPAVDLDHRRWRGGLLYRRLGRLGQHWSASGPHHRRCQRPGRGQGPADLAGPDRRHRPARLADPDGDAGPGRGLGRLLRHGLSGLPAGLPGGLQEEDRRHVPRPRRSQRGAGGVQPRARRGRGLSVGPGRHRRHDLRRGLGHDAGGGTSERRVLDLRHLHRRLHSGAGGRHRRLRPAPVRPGPVRELLARPDSSGRFAGPALHRRQHDPAAHAGR